MRRITHISDNSHILVFVQGFMGNTDTQLSQTLQSWSEKQGYDFWTWNFKGHEISDPYLSTLSEQIFQLRLELTLLATLYPEKHILCVTHSQGSYIALRTFYEIQQTFPTVFLNPALDLTNIILHTRLTSEEQTHLANGHPIFKEFSSSKRKWLTPEWYQEYLKFSLDFHVTGDTFYAIWGTEDAIISETDRTLMNTICKPQYIDITGDHSFSKSVYSLALTQTLTDLFIS